MICARLVNYSPSTTVRDLDSHETDERYLDWTYSDPEVSREVRPLNMASRALKTGLGKPYKIRLFYYMRLVG